MQITRYQKYKENYDKYREENREKIRIISLNSEHNKNFGGNREKTLERDGFKCVKCGIFRTEHKEKYGFDLTVDHIDGKGLYSKEKNHDLDNLQTLCIKCHNKKDNSKTWFKKGNKAHLGFKHGKKKNDTP